MFKFINDNKIYEKKLIRCFNNFFSHININLEILIKIINYLNFMELFIILIVKLTNERFYLRKICDESRISIPIVLYSLILATKQASGFFHEFFSDLLKRIKYSYKYYIVIRAGR